ncbi:B-cell receptor CD22-like [Aulostomus maculatus]
MSGTAAETGFAVLLFSLQVVQSGVYAFWGVRYSSEGKCGVPGSTVDMSCTYRYPTRGVNDVNTFWFIKDYEDLKNDPAYEGRVQTLCEDNKCTLRISDLRVSDSAEYKFRIVTDQHWGRFSPAHGVTLSVFGLWVEVSQWSYSGRYTLRCMSVCTLARGLGRSSCYNVNYTYSNICAFKGSSVEISCSYTSITSISSEFWFSPSRSDQWKISSRPEALEQGHKYSWRTNEEDHTKFSYLNINNLTESDSAQYHFKFRSRNYEWMSSLPGVTLTVTALQVKASRRPEVHQASTAAELLCHSSCKPAGRLYYVWYLNGDRTQSGYTYKVSLLPGDSVSCAVEGWLQIRSPPMYALKIPWVLQTPSGEILEGRPVTLSCQSNGTAAASYTWGKTGNPGVQILRKEQEFVFNSIQSSDSGMYYCTAENELGERRSDTISIDVKYPPKLSSVSANPSADILEGSSLILICNSDANPPATYTWYKENQTLVPQTNGTYHFDSISSKDSGLYHCKSENQYGQINSSSLTVNVQYAPKRPSVSVSPSEEVTVGSSVNLSCSSDANPAANYTWYKENEDSPKAAGQILALSDMRPEHSGSYNCEARNSIGRHTATVNLTVAAPSHAAAIGSLTAILLAVIFLVFLLMRNKRSLKQTAEAEARPQNTQQCDNASAGLQDELEYSVVSFSKAGEDPIYFNVTPGQPCPQTQDDDTVEYSVVSCSNKTPLQRAKDEGDPFALYCTVSKNH